MEEGLLNYLKSMGLNFSALDKWKPAVAKGEHLEAESNEILIYGPIVDEFTRSMLSKWFGEIGFVSGNSFQKELKAMDDADITVRINSPGGDINEGAVMQTLLTTYKGEVSVIIDGLCASAATFLLLPSSNVAIGELGQVMIHNAWTCSCGDKKEMANMAKWLGTMDNQIAEYYVKRTNLSKKKVEAMMDAETLFSAKDALGRGLVDEIVEAKAEKDKEGEVMSNLARARAQAQALAAKYMFTPPEETIQ